MKSFKYAFVLLCGLSLMQARAVSQNHFNRTPPMGWEPWNIDHCGPLSLWDAAYYKKLGDFFITSGLKDLGYQYLTIECGNHYRDDHGNWQADSVKFPKGFQEVTSYLHTKGLLVRAYGDAGRTVCCCNQVGSYSYYYEDAKSWVDMGFDGVKIDWCGGREQKLDTKTQFMELKRAVDQTGKTDFSIEICCWGWGKPWVWGKNAGQFWRTAADIDAEQVNGKWEEKRGGSWNALMRNIDSNRHPQPEFVGPGKGWNYPDMLVVGIEGGLTPLEERTQFSMACIMASPLFLGNDVFHMSEETKKTVMNKEVIAIDQDPAGAQGEVIREFKNGQLQIWSKPLSDGTVALALLNRSLSDDDIIVQFADLSMPENCDIRNLWEGKDYSHVSKKFTIKVKAHETALLKLNGIKK